MSTHVCVCVCIRPCHSFIWPFDPSLLYWITRNMDLIHLPFEYNHFAHSRSLHLMGAPHPHTFALEVLWMFFHIIFICEPFFASAPHSIPGHISFLWSDMPLVVSHSLHPSPKKKLLGWRVFTVSGQKSPTTSNAVLEITSHSTNGTLHVLLEQPMHPFSGERVTER